jgi:eukaryotic-like serine/threonine-protein kinase
MDETNELVEGNSNPTAQRRSLDGLLVAGSYRISSLLGRGGMGDVYLAEHVRLGSPVAVKFMRDSGEARSVERFRREARRIAALRSDHIVKVFDYGELSAGTPYLVMERLVGEDLRRLLERDGPLPVRRAVKLMMDACRGLTVVHRAALVHRDLKPANLFVEATDVGPEVCKILDFGVVKAQASESTQQGALLGTVRYMAPEQLEDASAATPRADVYALGAILYECLCGVPANPGATIQDTMFSILQRDPRPPSELRAIPSELESVILRALSRDPGARYATAEELGRALAPFGPMERAPRPMEALGDDTLSDGALAMGAERSREPSVSASRRLFGVALASICFGILAGWLVRGPGRSKDAQVDRLLPANTQVAVPAHPRAPSEPSPADLVSPPPAEPKLVEVVREQGRPPRAATSGPILARKRPPQQRSSAATSQTPADPPAIVGRFDPSDPYE